MSEKGQSGAGTGGGAGGSALVVVLWVIGLLSLLVVSFAFDAHLEARVISYVRKRLKADSVARSGMEVAQMLMVKRGQVKDNEEPDKDDRWYDTAKRMKEGGEVTVDEAMGDGKLLLTIAPEPALRNINNLGQNEPEITENLERILEVGGVPENLWPGLIETFLDWVDPNDDARIDGAETDDYYATLDQPYKAKNGPLDTVGELLLIKNWSRPILYGGVLNEQEEGKEDRIAVRGIADLLTTYGSGKVNVNAALPRVLMTLPEVDEVMAGAIVEEREGTAAAGKDAKAEWSPFKSPADFCGRMEYRADLARFLSTDIEQFYSVTSIGESGGVQRRIACVVQFDGANLKVLRWSEEE